MFVLDLTLDITDNNGKLCYKDKACFVGTCLKNWYQRYFLLPCWPFSLMCPTRLSVVFCCTAAILNVLTRWYWSAGTWGGGVGDRAGHGPGSQALCRHLIEVPERMKLTVYEESTDLQSNTKKKANNPDLQRSMTKYNYVKHQWR